MARDVTLEKLILVRWTCFTRLRWLRTKFVFDSNRRNCRRGFLKLLVFFFSIHRFSDYNTDSQFLMRFIGNRVRRI